MPCYGQALAHRAVFQVQMRGAIEGETHPQDQPTPRLLLEQAVAVGEVALCKREVAQLAGLAIEGGQAGENVLDLDAISADVLHRCRADGAGNQAEVFQARQALAPVCVAQTDARARPPRPRSPLCCRHRSARESRGWPCAVPVTRHPRSAASCCRRRSPAPAPRVPAHRPGLRAHRRRYGPRQTAGPGHPRQSC